MPEERRVAVVTGAGHGIGLATAGRLLRDGWTVAVAELDTARGGPAAEELSAFGACRFVHCDVANEASVAGLAKAVLDEFGRVDGLVNNAGVMVRKPVTELALADWNRVIGTNLTGAYLCAKHLAPALKKTRGAIVNIASTRAHMSEPDTEAYAASKGGLVALTHALAMSLGPEVRVNCVSPGWIHTKESARLREIDHAQHPAGRVGQPSDVAGLIAYLLSDAAGFATGAEFVLDGGMTRKMIYVE